MIDQLLLPPLISWQWHVRVYFFIFASCEPLAVDISQFVNSKGLFTPNLNLCNAFVFLIPPGQFYAGNDTLIEYCEKGARYVEGWSCSRRVKALMRREGRVSEDPVVEALERCCLAMSHGTARSTSVNRPPPPPIDFTSPNARSHFPESWMYQDTDILITG